MLIYVTNHIKNTHLNSIGHIMLEDLQAPSSYNAQLFKHHYSLINISLYPNTLLFLETGMLITKSPPPFEPIYIIPSTFQCVAESPHLPYSWKYDWRKQYCSISFWNIIKYLFYVYINCLPVFVHIPFFHW